MEWKLFVKIIDDLFPHRKRIELIDLYGLGEPFLDRLLAERIRYAKERGFRNIGFSSNMALADLPVKKQREILESGVDTIIFSIDGATAPVYEAIRVNAKFEKTVENCLRMIGLRNEGGYGTHFLVRMVKQKANAHEEKAFIAFWERHIDRSRGDFLGILPAHSWGTVTVPMREDAALERQPCPIPFEVLYILADGQVTYCHEDWGEGKFNFGNARNAPVIDLFNSPRLATIRRLHLAGDKNRLPLCNHCTVPYTDRDKRYW
jgi:MoaA/NifB/PqqE/SkfB family radical SAM enzyme